METRESEDHWITRDLYDIGQNTDGDVIGASRICRTPGEQAVSVSVSVNAKIELDTFTILFSEDVSKTEYGTTCKISVRAGTYHFRLSEDGQALSVTTGPLVQRWRRYDPPSAYWIPRFPQ